MNIRVGNAQHIGKRSEQQDAFGFSDPKEKVFLQHGGFLGVVADGMGGIANGRAAGRAAVRAFLEAYRTKTPQESIIAALERSLEAANQAVVDLGRDSSAEGAMGTTLAAAVIHECLLYWISVGDSRVYLLRQNSLTQITVDHTYARELDREVAEGRISREEALNHPQRGGLTSFLGMSGKLEADRCLRPVVMDQDDCVILCSDGIYRAVTEEEICGAFRGDLNDACEMIMERSIRKDRNQQDNLTVIAFSNCDCGDGNLNLRKGLWIGVLGMALLAGVVIAWLFGSRLYTNLHLNAGAGAAVKSEPAKASEKSLTVSAKPSVPTSAAKKNENRSKTADGQMAGKDRAPVRPGLDKVQGGPSPRKPTDAGHEGAGDSNPSREKAAPAQADPRQPSIKEVPPSGTQTPDSMKTPANSGEDGSPR
jgi:protein phosphatase